MAQERPGRILGGANDTFWDWCARDELRLQRCDACTKLAWPVVTACEACGGEAFTWELMSGTARLESWCAFHQDYYRGAIPVPYDTILVALAEGPLFISMPLGFGYDDMVMGEPLVVDFIDCVDGGGAYRLPVFRRP